MYADDTALFSESASELQNMLDTLHVYTTEWNINVNINQTKVVVFRKGGNLKPDGKWTYNGKYLEIVDCFNYLGVCFHYNGKFNDAQKRYLIKVEKLCLLYGPVTLLRMRET